MANKPIRTEDVAIKTCTVEVKVITINNRQMTLSVFRQLPKKQIIDLESLTLCGEPWGLVRYSWDSSCSRAGHLHVVWQEGSDLRRACVGQAFDHDESAAKLVQGWQREQDDITCAAWVLHAHEAEPNRPDEGDYAFAGGWRLYRDCAQATDFRDWWQRKSRASAGHPVLLDGEWGRRLEQKVESHVRRAVATLAKLGITDDSVSRLDAALKQQWRRLADRQTELKAGWSRLYQELAALDQLFIAT